MFDLSLEYYQLLTRQSILSNQFSFTSGHVNQCSRDQGFSAWLSPSFNVMFNTQHKPLQPRLETIEVHHLFSFED